LSFLWIGALVLGVAGSAHAALLNWEGTTVSQTGENPATFTYGGGVATVNGSSGVIPAHLNTIAFATSRGNISGTNTTFITDPETIGNGIAALIGIGRGAGGTFAPISGGAASGTGLTQNVLPVRGLTKVCILTTSCEIFLALLYTQPTLTVNGGPGDNVVGIGVGGLVTAGGGTNPIRISLEGAPWTIKTATSTDHITTTGGNQIFTPRVAKGFAHGPASGTTSTAQPSGVIQLVTPAQVSTNLPFGSNAKLSSLTVTTYHFVPEPGLLLLIGSGVMGLALLGRRRIQK
jgi:hypothetical protein